MRLIVTTHHKPASNPPECVTVVREDLGNGAFRLVKKYASLTSETMKFRNQLVEELSEWPGVESVRARPLPKEC